ncbi:NAD-specific glutamate dehydrogenase [compost metagenome]
MSHGFVRVDVEGGEAAKQPRGQFAHQRHAGGAAHQQHFVELVDADSGIAQGPFNRIAQAFEQGREQCGHLVLGKDMLPLLPVHPQYKLARRFLPQRLADSLGFAAQRVGNGGCRWKSWLVALGLDKAFGQHLVEILTAQIVVAGAGPYLHDAVEQFQD